MSHTAENVTHRGNRSTLTANGFSSGVPYPHARRYLMAFCPHQRRCSRTIYGRRSSTAGILFLGRE